MLALVVCTLLTVWHGLVGQDWLRGILSGIALGMAMLPEEFPVALAIFLTIGSWRLAQTGVLVRRAAAVEALGAITCLCVDKTGTLTENRMRLRYLRADTSFDLRDADPLPPQFVSLLSTGCLASRRNGYDPIDIATLDLGDAVLPAQVLEGRGLVREYGITSELLALTQVWSNGNGELLVGLLVWTLLEVLKLAQLVRRTTGAIQGA